jgi:sensor histidine kinase YesM
MGYVLMDRAYILPEGMVLENIIDILSNSWALLLIVAGNVALTMHTTPKRDVLHKDNFKTWLLIIGTTLLISLVATAIIYFDIPSLRNPAQGFKEFTRILSAALLIDLIAMTIGFLTMIYIASRRELREEREEKHRSEYRYARLKQQITPHFLFNSLGILDYLVQERETERASAFIHKFADIYRYMLNTDKKSLVKISEELEFTMKYIDLLKERFIEGMEFEIDIEEQHMNDMVVPCSLQLLVENATKHNIVSAESPLRVRITTEDNLLVVRNNLQPRTHGQPSTNLGLRNIRQQYLDVAASDISIEKSDSEFIVKLPIV